MVGHPRTKGRATGENKPRPKPPRHTSTLPVCYGKAYTGRAAFRSDEVPGNGCVLYTVAVVNSPRQIEGEIARLRRKLHDLILQAVRGEAEPGIAAARRALEQERDRPFVCRDWLTGKPERLRRAEAAASEAVDDLAARSRGVGDPTELMLVDEVDRLKMSGLEQLRALFDGGGTGLVLIGMPGLERRLARYAQLYSRIGFVHEFRPLGAAEVRTLLAGWRPPGVALPADLLADAGAVAAIIRITGGNFRLLDRLLTQVGRILRAQRAGDGDVRGGRGGPGGPDHRRGLTASRPWRGLRCRRLRNGRL